MCRTLFFLKGRCWHCHTGQIQGFFKTSALSGLLFGQHFQIVPHDMDTLECTVESHL